MPTTDQRARLNADATREVARRAAASADANWYVLLVAAALDEGQALSDALDTADAASQTTPTPPADDSNDREAFADDQPRSPDGRFAPAGGSGAASATADASSDDTDTADAPDFTAPGATEAKGPSGLNKAARVAAKTVLGLLTAAPAVVNAIAAETKLPPKLVARAAMVANVIDYMTPGPVASSVLGVLVSMSSPGAPVKAARKAIASAIANRRKNKEAGAAAKKMREQFGAPKHIDKERKIVWYDAHDEGDGLWRFRIPVFAEVPGEDGREFQIDRARLEHLCDRLNMRAEGPGHYRALHDGHQDLTHPGTPEKPLIGFLEDARVEETNWGPLIYATVWGVEEHHLAEFERGRIPFVSIETDGDELLSVAAMRSKSPHFPFPNIWVRRVTGPLQASAASRQRMQFAHQARSRTMPDDKHPMMDSGDQFAADDDAATSSDDTDQFADDNAPGAPGAQPPDKLDQILQLLQKLANPQPAPAAAPAAPAPPAQMAASTPHTLRPLEPASAAAFAKDPAKLAQFLQQQIQDGVANAIKPLQEQQAKQQAQAQFGQLRRSIADAATDDEQKTLQALFRTSPEAAAQFAAHIRTRGPIVSKATPLTVVKVPKGEAQKLIEQFASDHKVRANDADMAAATSALQDWHDTMNSDDEDAVRVFSMFYGDDDGRQRWVFARVAEARDKAREKRTTRQPIRQFAG